MAKRIILLLVGEISFFLPFYLCFARIPESLISNSLEFPIFGGVPVYGYKVINTYPHDPNAFTQGLVFENDSLYEGTGLYGHSTLRKVELETGNILKIRKLANEYFGEGITIYKDTIIQLTWKSQIGFVYIEKDTFELLKNFSYPTQGWGITHNGTYLIMSDGSSTLHFLDPETFEEVHTIEVRANGTPVNNLNELEYIQGEIYANVWQTDLIAIIAPLTGQVVGWIDLEGLLDSKAPDVLNGIAYDADNDRLFVTGKNWPKLFEIEVLRPDIKVNPDSLSATLALNDSISQTMMISNPGNDTLTFSISEATSPQGKGQGGPDAGGYRWIDSDESGGPAYDWIDITTSGTEITGLGDDSNVGPFDIGFSFPFYDTVFDSFRFCTNGWISFTHTTTGGGDHYTSFPLPDTSAPKNILAAFWDDLNFSAGSSAYYWSDGEKLVVEFYNVPRYGGGSPYTFEIILKPDGTIIYQYESIGSPDDKATVGIQNDDGTIGLQVVRNSSYIHDDLAIKIYKEDVLWLSEDPVTGSVPPGETEPITVTFNSTGLTTDSTYKAWLVISSNDSDEPLVNVPVSLSVSSAPSVTLTSPDGGENWAGGTTHTITWSTVGTNFDSYRLLYSVDGGNSYPDTIAANVSKDSTSYDWTTPAIDCSTCRVKAQILDNLNNVISEDTSDADFTIDSSPPSVVVLISPSDSSCLNDSAVNFVWEPATDNLSGIDYYVLQHALDDLFLPDGLVEITSAETTFTDTLSDTTYYWKVKAIDKAGNEGDWSSVWSFEIDTQSPGVPTLISPISGVYLNNTSVGFQWSEVKFKSLTGNLELDIKKKIAPLSSPVRYILQVDTVVDFSNPVVGTVATTYDTVSLIEWNYYWRVRAYDLAGNQGSFANLDSFGVDVTAPTVPQLASPDSGIITNDSSVTFGWYSSTDNLSGVDYYILEYANNYLFIDATAESLSDTSYTTNLPDTVYYWRVKSVDIATNESSWSLIRNFLIDTEEPTAPMLVSPIDSLTTNDSIPVFIWHTSSDASSGVDYYILQYADDPEFTDATEIDTVDTTYIPAISLSDTTYYWKVKAIDKAGNEGDWSSVWSFEIDTQSPGVPTLVAPSDSSILSDNTPTFAWGKVTKSDFSVLRKRKVKLLNSFNKHTEKGTQITYNLRVICGADSTVYGTQDTVFTIPDTLDDSVYLWQVEAFDEADNRSGYSAPFTLFIDTQIPQISNTTIWSDTNFQGPFPVHSTITDNRGISETELWYKTSIDTNWASVMMNTTGVANEYLAEIPVQPISTEVSYYIYSEDIAVSPNEVKDPANAPDSCYSFRIMEVSIQEEKIPQIFFMVQNRPNPFIETTTIEYGLPKDANVKISVYNLSGQKVASLVDENKNAGYHTARWDGKDKSGKKLASGIYFYRFSSRILPDLSGCAPTDDYRVTKKMYLIK